ncbi:hypothetical protein PVAP13_9KG338000 [Panicum virgatum]|uniref:Uncharacterized protein n=1 Tax=Panicum virgatum TaxID=38727 RepID=A0A8T0NRL7_PANVG|nr:hypothetical protein PVAP13_9KG338000 [Panicum virgatum]
MAQRRTTIVLNMALFALLSFTLYFQARGEGALGPAASGQGTDTAEFVLLEPIPERLLLAATAGAVNATDPDTQLTELTCLQCNCCLKNTNPQVCLTTCCYQRICGESVFSIPEVVSCGCNHCVPPPSHHSHRPSLPPRTN